MDWTLIIMYKIFPQIRNYKLFKIVAKHVNSLRSTFIQDSARMMLESMIVEIEHQQTVLIFSIFCVVKF